MVALGPVTDVAVPDAPALARARAQAAAGDEELGRLVDLVAEGHGGRMVRVGPWHGDLSPWNTASRRHEVLVWDWELAAEGMPVGSDLRHAKVMVATHLRGVPATAALAPLDPDDPAVALYLLEVARRDRHARRGGRVDAGHDLGPAAMDRLRRWAR